MNFDGEFERAFLVGGNSSTYEFLAPLADAMASGENMPRVRNPEIITLNQARRWSYYLNRDLFEGELVVTHSLGIREVETAGIVIALAGAEPLPLREVFSRGNDVANSEWPDREDYPTHPGVKIVVPPLKQGAFELLKAPDISICTPFIATRFSTTRHLIDNADGFGTRMIFQFADDEFGFARPELIEEANNNGIIAAILNGRHCEPFYNPQGTLRQITQHLNSRELDR